MKIVNKTRSMRRELRALIAILVIFTVLVYTTLSANYFSDGLDTVTEISTAIEAREFARQYQDNPNTPLPSSFLMKSFLGWENVSPIYKKVKGEKQLSPGVFYEFKWPPVDDEDKIKHFLIYYVHILHDGTELIFIYDYDKKLLTEEELTTIENQLFWLFIYGGGYVLLVFAVFWFYSRRLANKTDALARWAETLNLETPPEPVEFSYTELNRIATQLQQASSRITRLLEREKRMLRYTSHELRTPIAVIRASMEFLQRCGVPPSIAHPIERIRRANHSMQQLTETILWLHREGGTEPATRDICLETLVSELQEDLSYLLKGKPVTLKYNARAPMAPQALPETPLRIVISNLIRNAFQHTQEGHITIDLAHDALRLRNHDIGANETDREEGFGLGILLIKQICRRLHWALDIQYFDGGAEVKLTFSSPSKAIAPSI